MSSLRLTTQLPRRAPQSLSLGSFGDATRTLAAALAFVANWFIEYRAYHNTDRNGILGEHTITLAPEALHERTAVNDSKASWSGIFRIDATRTHLFIFTQPNAAHVIPRRAFPTAEAAEQFLSTARAYHSAAASPAKASAR